MEKFENYSQALEFLQEKPLKWLVTGGAGFIGSNIAETLIRNNQNVLVVDNFITGHQKNIDELIKVAADYPKSKFEFIEGDIRDYQSCLKWTEGVDKVMNQAALGSVPRSMKDPLNSHDHNVNGFINILNACKENGADLVYASSSSVYGDSPKLPKVEAETGNPLSPYAATKAINELYADVFARAYGMKVVGLRYFNVFGPRQDPDGPYAAVIPKWIQLCLRAEAPEIYGDGETSRDFCFVDNAVQANLMAALNISAAEPAQVFNVAAERQTSLNQLFEYIQTNLKTHKPEYNLVEPTYKDFRAGDIRHSLANITAARSTISYNPEFDVEMGLKKCTLWYIENLG